MLPESIGALTQPVPASGVIEKLRTEVRLDASAWGVSEVAAVALLAAPVVLVLVTGASLASRPVFRALTREDGPFEWAQFALFALAGGGSVLIGDRLRRARHQGWAGAYVLAAMAMLFIAAEEISWGQRIFGFDTPVRLAEVNAQGEVTVHNVGATQEVFKAGTLAVSLYGVAVPVLLRRRRPQTPAEARFAILAVPPLVLVPAFLAMAGFRIARYTVLPKTWTTVEGTETAELCLALALGAFVVLLARRLGREGAA